jgi:hypothetical protein
MVKNMGIIYKKYIYNYNSILILSWVARREALNGLGGKSAQPEE